MSKRAVGLIVLLVICFSLIVSCQDTEIVDMDWGQIPTEKSPASISKDDQIEYIIKLLSKRESDLLKSYVTAESYARYGDDHIVDRQREVDKRLGVRQINLRDISLIEMLSDDKIIVYEMIMNFSTDYGPIERPLALTFILNDKLNRWELEWTPSTIFPGLTANNEIVVEELNAPRGTIFDRAGRELAVDGLKQQVGAVSGVYNMDRHAEVAELLEMAAEDVEKKMNQSWIKDNMFVPLQSKNSYTSEQIAKFAEYGLSVRSIKARNYPYDEAFAHLVGYVGDVQFEDENDPKREVYRSGDIEGKRGLEALLEENLRSTRGVRISLTGSGGETLFERDAVAGKDYQLTVDAELQRSVYEICQENPTAVTVIDPFNGNLLALVSTPAFSPAALSSGISNKEYQKLVEDPLLPLLNRFQMRYHPGSTFKIATAIAAFNQSVLSKNTLKTIVGKKWQPDSSWGGYFVSRVVEYDQPQDLILSISNSDNIFFAQLALEMGGENFAAELKKLGLTEDVPSEYPFYTAQITNDGSFEKETMVADTAYGQGQLQITQVHLASIFAALVNGGVMYEPHVLIGNEGKIWKDNICAGEDLSLLRTAIANSVETTHKNTVSRSYTKFAGKSGTVQRGWDKELDKQVIDTWFVGFDNANPRFILAVQLQDMQRREDNLTAFSLFGLLMDELYPDGIYKGP